MMTENGTELLRASQGQRLTIKPLMFNRLCDFLEPMRYRIHMSHRDI